MDYTKNGFRVIGLAGKSLDESITWLNGSKITRDSIESELDFYGFLIMQNKIKPETEPVIKELKSAGLRTVMVTGDNLLTAVNVGRTCGLVGKKSKIILVEASNGRGTVPASIDWKLAEAQIEFDENYSYQQSERLVNFYLIEIRLKMLIIC